MLPSLASFGRRCFSVAVAAEFVPTPVHPQQPGTDALLSTSACQQHLCPFRDAGAASRSFTSTAQTVVTKNHRVTERIERCPKKKAYLRLSTTHGAHAGSFAQGQPAHH
jgi:hypothetical protein